MAKILVFPQRPRVALENAAPRGPAEIIIFPGVRVEYHGERAELDLSRRLLPAGRGDRQTRRPARAAVGSDQAVPLVATDLAD